MAQTELHLQLLILQFQLLFHNILKALLKTDLFAFLTPDRVDRDIAVADMMHWDDPRDLFERNPFAVRFEVPHCGKYVPTHCT